MPFHLNAPFRRKKIPKNVDPNAPLYFLEPTGEVFTEYDEFCYRTIQCNSLVWTCAVTGKSELTFSEALECERDAKQILAGFPEELKVPALYLASIAQSPEFQELVSDVFTFMKKHFFVNEMVVPTTKSKWKLGKVLRVKNPKGTNLQSSNKKSVRKLRRSCPPGWYEYEISASINGKGIQTTLTGSKLKRSDNFCLTKEALSIFLRQSAVLDARRIWVIKGSVLQQYNIQFVKFDDIFCGDPPVFAGNSRHKQKNEHGDSSENETQNKISEGRKINGVRSRKNENQVKSKSEGTGKQTGQQNIQKYFSSSKTSPSVQSNLNVTESDEEKGNDTEKYLKIKPYSPASVLANCSDEENANSGDELKVVSPNNVKPGMRAMKNLFEKMEVCVDQEQDRTKITKKRENSPGCRSSKENKDSSPTKDTPRRKLKQTRMFENRSSSRVDENKKSSFSVPYKKDQNNTRGRRKQKIVGTLKPWVQTTRKEKNSSVASSSVMKAQTSSTTQTLKEKKKNWLEMQREIELRERQKKQEERQKKKAKVEEDKLRFAKFMKEWRKHREDLLCEDLKPLPVPCEINCRIPNELFGDFMMVFEFFHSFSPVFKIKIPGGVTFELLEKALVETEIAGPLNDIVKVLLAAIFDLQVAENGKPKSGVPIAVDLNLDDLYDDDDVTPQEAISHSVTATGWCDVFKGVALHDIPMTSTTVSEILRLHMIGSGGRPWDTTSKWLNYRGGYTNLDDPGLWFRMEKPTILHNLSHNHISELLVAEKLEILCCLINQILTYASVRERVEERCEQARQLKAGVRSLQVAEIKLQKEATAQRIQEKKDAKLTLTKGSPKASANQAMNEKQRLEKEMNKLKVDLQRKSSKVLPLAMSGQLLPLGSDRAHRKYWLFSSIPGLFVEYNPYEIGPCLSQPTPRALELSDTLTHVRRLFEEEGHNSSDKENDSSDRDVTKPANASVKKMLGEQNSGVEVLNTGVQDEKENPITDAENVHGGELLLCTASDNCPVHCPSVSTSHWCFFNKGEDVTALLGSLNDRGIRESALLRVLKQEEQRIVESVSQCPAHKLNPAKFQFTEGEQRKSTRQHSGYKPDSFNLKFPPDTPISYIMEWTIRDCILELEKKITVGGIGSLKVHDRMAWRKAIEIGQYDKQCDKLVWGFRMRNKKQDKKVEEEKMVLSEQDEEEEKVESPEQDEEEEKVESSEQDEEEEKVESSEQDEVEEKAESSEQDEVEEKVESSEQDEEEEKVESSEQDEEEERVESEQDDEEEKVESPEQDDEEEKVESPEQDDEEEKVESPEQDDEEEKLESSEQDEEEEKMESSEEDKKNQKKTKENGQHSGEETMSEDDQLSSKNTGGSARVDCTRPPISQTARKLEEKMDVDEEENQNKTCVLKEDHDNHGRINQDPEDDCDLDDESSSSEDNESKSLDKEDVISTLTNVPPPRNPVIKDLASAILQVGQSLDPRCLKKPLAGQNGRKSNMKYWEVSLMNTINFSQLFIHHSTLENSINWLSSIYNSPCFVCDRRKNGNKMRFCDGCNKRFHMYCVKPKLKSIPEGSWQCHYCSPEESETIPEQKETISNVFTRSTTTGKKRKAEFDAELEEREAKIRKLNASGNCRKCDQSGVLVYCTACCMGYHSECTNSSRLRRLQVVNWLCDFCKEEAQMSLSNDKFEDESVDSAAEESGDDSPENSSDESSREISDESSDESINDSVTQTIRKKPDKFVIQSSVVQASLEYDDLISSPRERRGCASAARAKIASFTKRLRSNSWDDDNDMSLASRVEASYCNIEDYSSIRRSSRRSLVASEDLPLDNAVLQDLLTEMLQQENAWPFLRPVRKSQVPDYHVKIKRPMDLGTIKYKLNTAEYKTNRDFIKDILLVFENCFMYNDQNTIEYHCGKTMRLFFEKRSYELGLNWKRREMTTT